MNRIQQQDAKSYLLSGSAFVTVHNTQPKDKNVSQFSYTIRFKKGTTPQYKLNVWYVYNERDYIGSIYRDVFTPATSTRATMLRGKALEVFNWVWNRILSQQLPDNIHLLHNGTCGHCGRSLKDAISLTVGIGPECRKKLGIPTPKFISDVQTA